MNIHAYTLDSLRQLVRRLQKENAELRLLLKNANHNLDGYSLFESTYEIESKFYQEELYHQHRH